MSPLSRAGTGSTFVLGFRADGAEGAGGDAPGGGAWGLAQPAGEKDADLAGGGFRGVVEPVGDGVLNLLARIGTEGFEEGEGVSGVFFELGEVGTPYAAGARDLGGEAAQGGVGGERPGGEQGKGEGKVGGDAGAEGKPRPLADGEVQAGCEGSDELQAFGK